MNPSSTHAFGTFYSIPSIQLFLLSIVNPLSLLTTPETPKTAQTDEQPPIMASSVNVDATWLQHQLQGQGALADLLLEFDRSTIALTLAALVLVPVIASHLFGTKTDGKVPFINAPGPFELTLLKKFEYVTKGVEYLREGRRRHPGKPFKLLTNIGPVTILPPNRAEEVKNIKSLNFRKANSHVVPFAPAALGTLEILDRQDEILQKVIMKHLTKRLNTVTEPLALEVTFALDKNLGNNPDWTETKISPVMTDIVARLSSRVFLGGETCRDEEWLDITKNFTLIFNGAIQTMRLYPRWARTLVYYLYPAGKKSHAVYRRAEAIVEPQVAARRKEKAECLAKGLPVPKYNDAIEWVELELEGSKEALKRTDFQLSFSFVAIHTTSDLLMQTMLHLAANPDAVEALRREALEVLPVNGWKKTALGNLKLLDSALKEAQRLKPFFSANMIRQATEDIVLEDGTKLYKGELTAVDASPLRDHNVYENPDKFDVYRFYERRKLPGGEHKAQLVSPSNEHITFGYGKYMCPGRFFAANELKVALCHLLLKYDWKLADTTTFDPVYFGTDPLVNPENKLVYRRRKEEIDLDALAVDNVE
ncbi:hypothetical protein RB594_003512 [Gaeumannomyces avenae]